MNFVLRVDPIMVVCVSEGKARISSMNKINCITDQIRDN